MKLAQAVLQEKLVPQELLVLREYQVPKGIKEQLVQLVFQVKLAQAVLQEKLVPQEQQVLQVPKGIKEQLVTLVQLVPKEMKE